MWDVAVVGGGVGGCYLAHRLAGPRVALFEASARIGGRLCSTPLPGLPDVVAEYGAMRFDPTEHTVTDLIHHLGLGPEVIPFPIGRPENLAHLRGVLLRTRRLSSATAELPYRLRPDERGLTADGLSELAAEQALPGFTALRAQLGNADEARATLAMERYRQARRAARWQGRALHMLPWAALLDSVLSSEAAQLVQDSGGYDTRTAAGSAAHWLDTMVQNPTNVVLQRLRCGFEEVPRVLHQRFTAAGGATFLGHRLTGLERATGGYRLRFAGPDRHEALTQAVVLTLTQRAAELLAPGLLPLGRTPFRLGLASQHHVPAAKLFLTYPEPWWRRAGVTRGRSTTDLPSRQLWYWETPDGNGPAALLAVYADGSAHRYWAELAGLAPGHGCPGPAANRLVERAHALAVRLHGLDTAPTPSASGWQDWSADPYGGAWPVWHPGYDADEVIPIMRRPLPGEPVFWINDAWTPRPGSVEGVLQAAERVLQTDFRLAPPPWLRPDATRWEQS